MKALLLILALAGAATASEEETAVVAEHVPAVPLPEQVPVVAVQADAVETPVVFDEMRHMPIYGMPNVEANMYERLSMRAIHNKPLFLTVRMEGKKELDVIMLRNGFDTIFNDPKFEHLAKYLLSGPEKVGLIHSAALALQIPDLHYNINNIRVSTEVNPLRAFQIQMDVIVPWVFIIPKSEMPVVPEKLFELGTFQMRKTGVMVAREFMPKIAEVARVGTRYMHGSVPVDTILEPVFQTEDGTLGRYKIHGLHHDLQREPVFETEDSVLDRYRTHNLHHGLHRGLQQDVHIPYAYRHSSPAYAPLMIRGIPSYYTI